MIEYIFCFIKSEDILPLLKIIKQFKSLRIIEFKHDVRYDDYYFRIRHNKKIVEYGFEDLFENFDMEYEP